MRIWICALLFVMACTPELVPENTSAKVVPEPVEIVEEPPLASNLSKVVVPEPVLELSDKCVKLGCPRGADVVADISSGLYYECDCSRARWIEPEDLLCFANSDDAVEQGYRKAQSC